MADGPPESILQRHPELRAIAQARSEEREGQPISARCMHCGELLTITRIPEAHSITTHCPCGKTWERIVVRE